MWSRGWQWSRGLRRIRSGSTERRRWQHHQRTRANTSAGFTNSAQYEPSIAVLSDASFVVTWRADGSQDGSGWGIYAQRFSAAVRAAATFFASA